LVWRFVGKVMLKGGNLVARFYCAICLWLLSMSSGSGWFVVTLGNCICGIVYYGECCTWIFISSIWHCCSYHHKIFWLVHHIVWFVYLLFHNFCCLWCQNINLPHVNIWSVNDLLLVQRILVSLTLVLQRFGMATYLHKFLEFVHVALSVMYWMISTQVIVMQCIQVEKINVLEFSSC
jgi:hypothetical protein